MTFRKTWRPDYRIRRVEDKHGVRYFPERQVKTIFGRVKWKSIRDRYGSVDYSTYREGAVETIKRQSLKKTTSFETL